ncbi:hypothetical protein RhiirA4_478435 [Rhizophagus irregularis]|uniref:Uncharacterized protein n=1 Tax=Rhizophagus irregularis TaxID=588596 RepID=A0A2I1HEX1_9GLOM|nr:hypothetical protein RhiirA4_478435 [Rhizophagus irregularis]
MTDSRSFASCKSSSKEKFTSAIWRNSLLIKNNESFSERVCQLEDEARELKNEINQKEILVTRGNREIATKLEEIQALHSRVEELEQDVFLAEKRLLEMDSLKRKSE